MYRRRPGVEYVPLDAREDIYSAAQGMWLKNVPFDTMEETVMQILVKC